MDMRDRLDPELVAPLDGIMAATNGGFDLKDIPGTRAMLEGMLEAMAAEAPPFPGVETENLTAETDGIAVGVRLYKPETISVDSPALLWMHPGGYVIGSIGLDDLLCRQMAKDVGCRIVSVEYRLAPENPYPAALDDCFAALQWTHNESGTLGIDPTRIAVGGSSAGGGLAAALALRARDSGDVKPCFQLLVYPSINDRNIEQVSANVPENLFWSRESTLIGWQSYLGNKQGSDDVPAFAAPIRAEDLSGLPPAHIAVGALDMFVPDCLEYAGRLNEAGVEVGLVVYPGAFHAFDAFAPEAQVSQKMVADRNAALKRAFSNG
jgi:acetyl esterase/lipase